MTVSRRTWHVSTGCSRYVVVWREAESWPRYEHRLSRKTANWLRYWCFEPRIKIDRAGAPVVFFVDAHGRRAGYEWSCSTGKSGWVHQPDWIYPNEASWELVWDDPWPTHPIRVVTTGVAI